MKVRRQLLVQVDPSRVADFVPALVAAAANSGWERDSESEQKAAPCVRERIACFKREQLEEEAVTLAIHLEYDVPGKFVVSNVCQRSRGPYVGALSDNDYNALLVDFNTRVVRNLSGELNVSCSVSSDQIDFESLMSPPSFLALWGFSTIAGNPKPVLFLTENVKEYWYHFLMTIQRESHHLTPELLTCWLVQEEKWPANMAEGLGAQFDFGTALMAYVDNHPVI